MLHCWPVAAIELDRNLGHHEEILERIGNLTQEHANEGGHVPSTNDSTAGHVAACHHVVGQEQIIVRVEDKCLELRSPSQEEDVDHGIVDHVSGAKLQESIGKIPPPFLVFSLVLNLGRHVVFFVHKGDDQPRTKNCRVPNRSHTGGRFLGRNRIFRPTKDLDEYGFVRESNARQKDGAQQGQGNVKVGERNVDGWKSMVYFQIVIGHCWNLCVCSLAHDE